MARPNSRQTLTNYALRALGAPVLEINIDDDQIDDRLDEALQFYQEYHSDAVSRVFFKYQVTQLDIDNKYITVPESLLYVLRVLPLASAGSLGKDMFSAEYQMRMGDYQLGGSQVTLLDYEMTRQHMALVDITLNGLSQQITFSRHMNRLAIEVDWNRYLKVGNFVIVEAYKLVDPDQYVDVYNDMFLKRYFIALLKRQWSLNLIKFANIQLPGGVTIDGQAMFDAAIQEIAKIEEEMQLRFEMPADFFCG